MSDLFGRKAKRRYRMLLGAQALLNTTKARCVSVSPTRKAREAMFLVVEKEIRRCRLDEGVSYDFPYTITFPDKTISFIQCEDDEA
jgi:hypothetical protein